MSKKKKKQLKRLRKCRVRLSENCQEFFYTNYKRSYACQPCAEYLKKIGIHVLDFINIKKRGSELTEDMKKMEKSEVKETIEWLNDQDANITVIEKIPVKNDKGQIVGERTEEYKAKTSYDEMTKGIAVVEERINKNLQQIESTTMQLNGLGKVPLLTSEQIRLKENLRVIQANEQKRQLEARINNFNELIEKDKELIEKRKEHIMSRPEAKQ